MVFRLSVRGNLHDKHGNCRKQNDVNHAAFLKKNAQNKPYKEKARRDKPEFHESFSETLVLSWLSHRSWQRHGRAQTH
jgi:hypothetical protein